MVKSPLVLIDASYDPKTHIACLGYMIYNESESQSDTGSDKIYNQIQYKILENTTNTAAEIQGFIWMIEEILQNKQLEKIEKLTCLTDCQTLYSLNSRRNNLTLSSSFQHNIYKLYFQLIDQLSFPVDFILIPGHLKKSLHSTISSPCPYPVFSKLDRAVRSRLRHTLQKLKITTQ